MCKINKINFVFKDTVLPIESDVTKFLSIHGDGVKEVAFNVRDATGIYNKAKERGAHTLLDPIELTDEHGTVTIAKLYGYKTDCVLTLIDRTKYNGLFLPGYKECPFVEPLNKLFSKSTLINIDHLVHN